MSGVRGITDGKDLKVRFRVLASYRHSGSASGLLTAPSVLMSNFSTLVLRRRSVGFPLKVRNSGVLGQECSAILSHSCPIEKHGPVALLEINAALAGT